MSALPHEPAPAAYANPYRLEAHEGPQTLAELRAALAVIDPTALVAFNARLESAKFGADQAAVITEYRHLIVLRTRPEVTAAIEDALSGTEPTRPVSELWARLDEQGAA
ncbi:hypothetical protein [Streptomyces canus]|uniref:hypothetical protein n=1 Tax=Streptomyces canus TaxID=58343 RepID=UPI002E26E058